MEVDGMGIGTAGSVFIFIKIFSRFGRTGPFVV